MTNSRLIGTLALAWTLIPAAGCTGDTQAVAPASAPAAPAAPAAAPQTAGSGDVLATVGERSITRAQVEEGVRAELISVENQRYEALRGGLEQLISQALVEQEATARGSTADELMQTEVLLKITPPTDAEVEQLYDQAKDQLQGQGLEDVRTQLVGYLMQQKQGQRQAAFLGELRAKYPTKIALRAPTIEVETAGRPSKGGGADAPITIVMFSDYECPFCKRGEDVVDEVMAAYGDKVHLVFRDYPLPFHQNARPAAEAAHCANAQDKFWEYHGKLFENQSALTAADLKRYAGELGLDQGKFDTCLDEGTFKDAVQKDFVDGGQVGVDGTPAFFINGRMLSGAQPFEQFKTIIDEELSADS